ncbi:aspartate/glutamate racemase family protein [Brucepastera parasyntrophica]|uniref:aspartate/glutamate racemase family protein n=1 Tax=Brucepastera parasyntrophica TaxID=2880008 RepID=UPI00210BAB76|nr:aspartate/glutamate racemase family protein [Brucepastera parasyntrophica]ULQ59256.1 aspartate/glutamate racemase family protein [Brucepastera parasyntrophica]
MKTIGLIGGMSWESSAQYYSFINRKINSELGNSSSAKCLMYSFNFQDIEEKQHAGKWDELKTLLYDTAEKLHAAGADFIVLCTNTMHKVMDNFEADTGIPFLHIGDAAGKALKKDGIKKTGLLGTRFTMEEDFYRKRLDEKYSIRTVIPENADRETVHRIIYEELVRGIISDTSRNELSGIMEKLIEAGAEGIILGCTEIGLLVKEADFKLYDSMIIHADEAVRAALRD